jgi:hypothetical protein
MSMPVVPGNPAEYQQPYGADSAGHQPQFAGPPPASYLPPGSQPPQQFPAPQQPPYGQPGHPAPQHAEPPYVEPPRRAAFRAELVVDGTGQRVSLTPGPNIVGRGVDCDLQLMDQGVSRRHVDVHIADGHAVVYDLGSTNGTSVNGHTVQSQQLQHGDVIRVGHSRLVYHQDGQ